VYCFYQLPAHTWLSSRLEAGTSDDFVQFLGGLGHLAQLSGNRVKIPGRRSTRVMQLNHDPILTPHSSARLVITSVRWRSC
jgi:hypothetical protein